MTKFLYCGPEPFKWSDTLTLYNLINILTKNINCEEDLTIIGVQELLYISMVSVFAKVLRTGCVKQNCKGLPIEASKTYLAHIVVVFLFGQEQGCKDFMQGWAILEELYCNTIPG